MSYKIEKYTDDKLPLFLQDIPVRKRDEPEKVEEKTDGEKTETEETKENETKNGDETKPAEEKKPGKFRQIIQKFSFSGENGMYDHELTHARDLT